MITRYYETLRPHSHSTSAPEGSTSHECAWFDSDDYVDVFQKYFAEITRTGTWNALPAGWHNPHSIAADAFSPTKIDRRDLQRYALDEGYALEESKSKILALIDAWEERKTEYAEVTLFPSVSSANLGTIAALANLGFRQHVFETPTYYATLDQVKMLGLSLIRIPSFRSDQFEADLANFEAAIRRLQPCGLWITQPRFGLGSNQQVGRILALARLLGPENVMVIDEAAEQAFPSTLSKLPSLPCPVVRTRGVLKGIGLNGLRIAVAIHPSGWRSAFENVLEPTGASLDRFSLTNAAELAQETRLFSSLLRQANDQVRVLQQELSIVCAGTSIETTRLENGYMGTLMFDFTAMNGTYEQKRRALLEACRSRRMPIVLKASIGFRP